MLGAIIGDIIGSRWEFNPTNDYNFELFSDKNSYTDDTICTIAVADALLHNSDDYGKYIHKWCRKYPHPMGGYGVSFANWVKSDNPQPYGSYGNGAAMRVSPIGWWFGHPKDLYEQSAKAAACSHNHEEGITGAQTVAIAVADARKFKSEMNRPITPEDIDVYTIPHAIMQYYEWPQNFNLNIENYRNKFDETCQGTVPPALWIVLNSTSFEDAIRKAVSLGADADTLGAIVGSIAEPIWGIPDWMKEKALSYLPEDMKDVIRKFHSRVRTLRHLTKENQYYVFGEFTCDRDKHEDVYQIEKKWAHDLAEDNTIDRKVLEEMTERFPLEQWQGLSDKYDLPLSLIGYLSKKVLNKRHKTLKAVANFLESHYSMRKQQAKIKVEERIKKQQFKAIMFWKLCLGNPNKVFEGKNPLPDKSKVATFSDWKIEPFPTEPNDFSDVTLNLYLSNEDLEIIRRGHIPEVQEDHWFMFCDEQYIRYYRSWTGMCAFEAHYEISENGYKIDNLKMNRGLVEFGVNGDDAGIALFQYLLAAETCGDSETSWQHYLDEWNRLNEKYSKNK